VKAGTDELVFPRKLALSFPAHVPVCTLSSVAIAVFCSEMPRAASWLGVALDRVGSDDPMFRGSRTFVDSAGFRVFVKYFVAQAPMKDPKGLYRLVEAEHLRLVLGLRPFRKIPRSTRHRPVPRLHDDVAADRTARTR